MTNKDVAKILEEIGNILDIKGENPFKAIAYYNAARKLEAIPESVETLVREGRLGDIKGFGDALVRKVTELVTTGRLEYYEKLKSSVPESVVGMLRVQGLGPKKISVLWKKLNITNIGELEYACRENRLLSLKGFGARTQEKILSGIELLKRFSKHHLLPDGEQTAEDVLEFIRSSEIASKAEVAGSIRRRKEIVKDVDILVAVKNENREKLLEHLREYPEIEQTISTGEEKLSFIAKSGMQVDVRFIADDAWGPALLHFTGSKEHNIRLRQLAKERNLKLNEYGLFSIDGERVDSCNNEKCMYNQLGLPFIPPEMREDRGEVELALSGKALPHLVELSDIKGLFHLHTNWSDGVDSIEEYVRVAIELGYQYIGISDHSKSAHYANGLTEERVFAQWEEIDNIQRKYPAIRIFKGIESDILPDGSLDYSDDVLARFDFVLGSVHTRFNMTETEATERLINALRNPYLTMLGHPTGRLLLAREGYPVDMKAVIDEAAGLNKVIELNADPHRLDIDWRMLRYAKEKGVLISINPDTHNLGTIGLVRYGIYAARKGWLEKDNILNTRSADDVARIFKSIRGKG
ncbi:DNA polymerase/3'-5' exonuclease PolX [bacterium]|nr:DNA polymerase/3'-5' exonuclease PolX [bacterium]